MHQEGLFAALLPASPLVLRETNISSIDYYLKPRASTQTAFKEITTQGHGIISSRRVTAIPQGPVRQNPEQTPATVCRNSALPFGQGL